MFLSKDKAIEDEIIEVLKKGPRRTTELVKSIKATKQGVYRVLRLLKKEEVIVIHNKQVSINLRWLNKINQFSSLTQYYYQEEGTGHFANLHEGEKIKYTFNNLATTDAFWNHAVYILLETIEESEHFFAYNPHCWFFLARPEDERAVMRGINKRGKLYLVTTGSRAPMDKIISQEVDNKKSQYCMLDKLLFKDQRYYLNILGDFLIEVYFDKKITRRIERWYQKNNKKTKKAINELKKIVESKGKTKLVISRNQRKATRLKKRLSKNFYIPINKV